MRESEPLPKDPISDSIVNDNPASSDDEQSVLFKAPLTENEGLQIATSPNVFQRLQETLFDYNLSPKVKTGLLVIAGVTAATGIGILVKKERDRQRMMTDEQFEQLSETVETLYPRVLSYIGRKVSGQPHIAEDLTQETFLKVHNNYHKFQPKDGIPHNIALSAYVFTAARNRVKNHYRDNERLSAKEIEELLNEEGEPVFEMIDPNREIAHAIEEEIIDPSEELLLLRNNLHRLSEREKLVILLKYFLPVQLSDKQIAFITGDTTGAIKSFLFRIRSRLKKEIELDKASSVDKDLIVTDIIE